MILFSTHGDSLVLGERLCSRPLTGLVGKKYVRTSWSPRWWGTLGCMGVGDWGGHPTSSASHSSGRDGGCPTSHCVRRRPRVRRCLPQIDVWEFADPSQENLRGRIVVRGEPPLEITAAVHPERIQTKRRAEITNLYHRLVRPCEDEQVVYLQVPIRDAFVLEPPQPPKHLLQPHALDLFWYWCFSHFLYDLPRALIFYAPG